MLVFQDARYGWCVTKPGAAFTDLVLKNCRAGCFKLERMKTYRDGTPKVTKPGEGGKETTVSRTKQSYRKYTCPGCGLIARTTKDANLTCSDCQQEMTLDA